MILSLWQALDLTTLEENSVYTYLRIILVVAH